MGGRNGVTHVFSDGLWDQYGGSQVILLKCIKSRLPSRLFLQKQCEPSFSEINASLFWPFQGETARKGLMGEQTIVKYMISRKDRGTGVATGGSCRVPM